jgi:hypothetical protein
MHRLCTLLFLFVAFWLHFDPEAPSTYTKRFRSIARRAYAPWSMDFIEFIYFQIGAACSYESQIW